MRARGHTNPLAFQNVFPSPHVATSDTLPRTVRLPTSTFLALTTPLTALRSIHMKAPEENRARLGMPSSSSVDADAQNEPKSSTDFKDNATASTLHRVLESALIP